MLLGLVAAVMLAVLLQLNAQRSSRSAGSEFAVDGTIDLRCWVVVETRAAVAIRPDAILALPAPRRPADPLRFVGEMRMLRRPAAPRPVVKTPPDVIIIPGDILHAVMAAEDVSASLWQSPPGLLAGMPSHSMAATLH